MDEKKRKAKRLLKLNADIVGSVFDELETIDSTFQEVGKILETKADKTDVDAIAIDLNTKIENIQLVKGDKGDDGKDYILTSQDKQEIASSIKVPVVEKIIEKRTEVIKEPSIVQNITQVIDRTPIVQESAQKVLETIIIPEETGQSIVNKVNLLPTDKDELKIDAKHIKNLPKGQYIGGVTEQRVIDLISQTSTSDEKVKLSASDPTAGYLDAKLQEGVTAIKAGSSAGFSIKGSGGTTAVLFGAGGGNNATFYDGVKLDAQTADRILGLDSSKNITALDTATYPSLTELSYVKGVTSAIQTQLDAKANLNSTNQPFTYLGLNSLSTSQRILFRDGGGVGLPSFDWQNGTWFGDDGASAVMQID